MVRSPLNSSSHYMTNLPTAADAAASALEHRAPTQQSSDLQPPRLSLQQFSMHPSQALLQYDVDERSEQSAAGRPSYVGRDSWSLPQVSVGSPFRPYDSGGYWSEGLRQEVGDGPHVHGCNSCL